MEGELTSQKISVTASEVLQTNEAINELDKIIIITYLAPCTDKGIQILMRGKEVSALEKRKSTCKFRLFKIF